jgi:hypothetical protein
MARSQGLHATYIPLTDPAMAHTILQLLGYSFLAISRSPGPDPRVFSHEVPINNPTCRSNGPPTIRIQRLSSFLCLTTSRLGVPTVWALTLRTPKFTRSLDLLPLVLLIWTATILSLLRRFASSHLATLNTQYLGFHFVNSRVGEIS